MRTGLLLPLCGILFLGCKPGPADIYPNLQIMQGFNFQPRSYWIYYDSVTGQEDSMYFFQKSYMEHQNVVVVDVATELVSADSLHRSRFNFRYDGDSFVLSQPLTSDINLLQYPLRVGPVFRSDTSFVESANSTIAIAGRTFDNVIIVRYNSTGDSLKGRTVQEGLYCLKENVGFLKIEMHYSTLHVDHNYNLVRYHVEK